MNNINNLPFNVHYIKNPSIDVQITATKFSPILKRNFVNPDLKKQRQLLYEMKLDQVSFHIIYTKSEFLGLKGEFYIRKPSYRYLMKWID